MSPPRLHARSILVLVVLAAACGGNSEKKNPGPYEGTPPLGAPIPQNGGTDIGTTGWKWVDFPDTVCTNADYKTSTTGLAISWGTGTDLVVFLAGGGACWDYVTCAAGVATTGPFGPAQFQADIFDKYPNAWVHRDKLPAALADATIVFVPYCTGDVHTGDKVSTYAPPIQGLPTITWHHVGHTNLMAFLKRLGATFPTPGKLVVAGSSAGGFGSLANYPAFRWYWKNTTSFLIDDSGPPLIGDAIPPTSRAAWYANWDMGATLGAFCSECPTDLSAGIKDLKALYPNDRMALLSHLQDLTIREFFGSFTLQFPYVTPMDATTFKTHLLALGTTVIDPAPPSGKAKYFFSNRPTPETHPMLLDPASADTPSPGLPAWIQQMLSDDPGWASATDP